MPVILMLKHYLFKQDETNKMTLTIMPILIQSSKSQRIVSTKISTYKASQSIK